MYSEEEGRREREEDREKRVEKGKHMRVGWRDVCREMMMMQGGVKEGGGGGKNVRDSHA